MSIKRLIEVARWLLTEVGYVDPRVEVTKDPRHGELTCASPFELASKEGRRPMEIAIEMVERVRGLLKDVEPRLIDAVEAVNPGFVNFHVSWPEFARLVVSEVSAQGRDYGFSNLGGGSLVLIEHTSVNPNKPLHLGHGRNVVIGDTLYRLLDAMGYRVIVANYVDDSGNQMADLHVAFSYLGYSTDPPDGMRFDEYCGVVYAEVSRKIEGQEELRSLKRRIMAELEDPRSERSAFNRSLTNRVLEDQLRTCWRLGARYDVLNRESDVVTFKLWDEVFKRLLEAGAIYKPSEGEKAGCWLIRLSDHPVLSKEGDEVLVRSDGTTTYVARDIAYAAWKLGILDTDFKYSLWGRNPDGTEILVTDSEGDRLLERGRCSLSITVVDVRQRRPQEVVRYAISKIGGEAQKYLHFGYEVVALSAKDARRLGVDVRDEKFVHMSGREGLYLTVDAVLNLLKSRAIEEARKRHPDWDEKRLEDVGEKIALAALRYDFLKQDTEKMIIFDSEKASELTGDTGPYLQYSYARAARIIEKAPTLSINEVKVAHQLTAQEKELIRTISIMPLVMEEAAKLLLLKKLTAYAKALCSAFNEFYEHCPVLSAEREVMCFRLELVKSFMTALENVARIIGTPLLREM